MDAKAIHGNSNTLEAGATVACSTGNHCGSNAKSISS
jgi:hypothetical protein